VVEAIERHDPGEAEIASLAMIDYSADEVGGDLAPQTPMR
jgi:hypothetical protein